MKTPKQKNDSEFLCYKYAKCKMRWILKTIVRKNVFFDTKLPKVTFLTTKSYILRFGREKCDMVLLNMKVYFELMMIIFLAVSATLQQLEKSLNYGEIFCLHATCDTNITILKDFIEYANDKGYTFGVIE